MVLWLGGTGEKCGATTSYDFVRWNVGDLTDYHRVMDVKIYDLS